MPFSEVFVHFQECIYAIDKINRSNSLEGDDVNCSAGLKCDGIHCTVLFPKVNWVDPVKEVRSREEFRFAGGSRQFVVV